MLTWLHNVSCQGGESHLISCPNNGIGIEFCGSTHSQDVAIYCTNNDVGEWKLCSENCNVASYTVCWIMLGELQNETSYICVIGVCQ